MKPGDILISRLVMLLVITLVFSLPVVIPVIIVRCSLGAVGGYEVLAFALVYGLIYSMTARSYYKIVEKA